MTAGTLAPARSRLDTLRRRPILVSALAVSVVAGLLLPLLFLLFQAAQFGWSRLSETLGRSSVLELLWNTVRLAVAVTILTAVIGTAAAWLTERTDLPCRRLLTVALVLPLVVPDFVVAWSWSSVFPAVHGYLGAVLVMTLGLYPLVYLPMAAAFRSADPGQEEAARSLGLSKTAAWLRVSVRQARATLLGGCLLVCLGLLAEYGAFEDLRYQTFTTAIFTELGSGLFNPAGACALALVLVLLSGVVLGGEASLRERGRLHHAGASTERELRPRCLGRATLPALVGLVAVAALALVFPLAVIVYWMLASQATTLPATLSVGSAAAYTAGYSAVGAGLATVGAVPVALVAVRHPNRLSALLERTSFIVQALPGIVIALAFVYVTSRYAPSLYESPAELVVAYGVMFFPLALVAVRTSVARAPARLEEIGRSLGDGPLKVRLRVTLPLILPGLGAAFCLVFLSCVTELTATLLLVPSNVETLSTQFWAYTENISYHAAAPYALTMVALAAVPGYLLTRLFDRRARRGAVAAGIVGAP